MIDLPGAQIFGLSPSCRWPLESPATRGSAGTPRRLTVGGATKPPMLDRPPPDQSQDSRSAEEYGRGYTKSKRTEILLNH